MRFIVSVLCLLFISVSGCHPAEPVRMMREKGRQKQEENNERQVKRAMENYNAKYEGLDKAKEQGSKSNKQ